LRAEKKQQCKNADGDLHDAHLLADLHLGPAHVLQKSLPLGHRFLGRFGQNPDQIHFPLLRLHEHQMAKSVRRVVTGHDVDGRSTFLIDGPTPHVFSRSKGSAIVHELWETTRTPADNRGNDDAIARGHRLPPPQGGSVFRVI
jgi:hypothetical protein